MSDAADLQHREKRQRDFYQALSRTNRAIVRMTTPAALYQEICTICVEHGHASIAYVSLVDGSHVRPVAWSGPAESFLDGFEVPLDDRLPEGRGPTAVAVRSATRCVVNDYEADPGTLPWRARAAAIGTRSAAAFPFRRAGRVAGTLSVHMTVEHFFDERLIDLIDEMAEDISFALDNFDRDAARDAAERQLAGLVDTAMDAFISIDAQQRIVLFNQAAADMFGTPAEHALGLPVDQFIPPPLRERHLHHVTRFASTGSTARRMGALHTLVGLRANGEEFPIEASISKHGEGASALMTVVIRDASELRRAERSRLAQAAAESASRAKTEFLSHMSHELRTPLNAVLGFSQLLQSDPNEALSANQRLQVEQIRKAGWHLLALINDVLDVTKIEAGKIDVEDRSVDVHEVLDETYRLMAGMAEAEGVRMHPNYRAHDAERVRADPVRLRQVIINIVSNAIKYNQAEGSVRIDVLRESDQVHIDVADTGLGMSSEQLSHLFEPFNRLGRDRGTIEGTGLGLALTRQLVELMKGRVTVTSTLGRGTVVRVSLPAHVDNTRSEWGALPTADAGTATLHDEGPAGVVLYIEDNPVNMLLVEQLLSRWPQVTLVPAETGEEGISLARSMRPDVVLLDMRLPDMDGLSVLAALRADASTRGLRVVALSASAMPDEVARATQAGAQAYWTKPIDFDQFIAGMSALLARAVH